jgi:hypothetical protein
VRLDHLFDADLVFDEPTGVHVPTYGDDGDWSGYVTGTGTIEGERLHGTIRWTNRPRRRADGTWLPRMHGVVETSDGAQVLFDLAGYNRSLTERFAYTQRSVVATMTFETGHESHRWLNDVFAVAEGAVRIDTANGEETERWRLRVYACVDELPISPSEG